jgi:tetratricopeptide (TPR) repeat protein
MKTLVRTLSCLAFGLAAAACFVPTTRCADKWTEVKCPHFTVQSNAGEKEARKICDQFELFRATFHSAFSTLRVDPGQPLTIIAAKNENTMKEFLPAEYEEKGHVHPVGLYQGGPEKHYVVLRCGTEGDRPYHTLYHEYTHALMHLNFANLPLWLDEGLAEYLGNASLGDKEVRIGLIDPSHLYILQQNKFLPIETLLGVDHSSPYYNEQDRASVFYAESWALVHYLLLDPDARQKGLLSKFLAAWTASNDQIGAARQTFGELKKFGQVIDGYASRRNFYNGIVKPPTEALDKNYPVRALSSAEVLALRGDFFVHHNRMDAAKELLEEALKQNPSLPFAHEAMGMYYFRNQESNRADNEMKEAIRLGSVSFVPRYMHGYLLLQGGIADQSTAKEAVDALTATTKMNSQFAPAFDALASVLGVSPATRSQAIAAEIKAAQLEPSTKMYAVHLTYLLLNANRVDEAKIMATRIAAVAQTPTDKQTAADLMQMVGDRATWLAKLRASGQNAAVTASGSATTEPDREKASVVHAEESGEPVAVTLSRRPMAIDGEITSVICSGKQEVTLVMEFSKAPMSFHVTDLRKIQLIGTDSSTRPEIPACAEWNGRRAKIWFQPVQGKNYSGEIVKIQLF